MSTKFSRKTFLKGSVAGLGMMALNVCTAGAASAAEPAAAAAEDTNSLNLIPKKAASVKVTSRGSVSGGWQGEPVFPNWKGYVDDTLAMNHMYTFVGYAGQGTALTCSSITARSTPLPWRQAACGTWIFPARLSTAATPFRWAASVPAAKR